MPFGFRRGERLHRCRPGVIAQDFGQDVEESTFAVAAPAVYKKQGMLPNRSGKAHPAHLLQEPDMRRVSVRGLSRESQPPSRYVLAIWRPGSLFRDEQSWIGRIQLAAPKVHNPGWRSQEPRVAVPNLGGNCECPVRLCKFFH